MPKPPLETVETLRTQRDELARVARNLCGECINSHGRDKVICICCEVVSDDRGEPAHDADCGVGEALAAIARIGS